MSATTGFSTIAWVGLDALLVGCVVLVLRASYRWVQDRGIFSRPFALEGDEGDVMTHLFAIDMVRANGHRIPRETPQFLCSTGFDYPALFHKLLSYIPRRWLERGEWLVSPGFEGLHAALVYLAAWLIFTQVGAAAEARALALVAAAGWAVTPLLARNPRRGCVLGERCFGYIFGHMFLFCAAMATATENHLWIAPAVLTFTVGAASSKFAAQAMTFISLAMAAIGLDPMPLLVLLVSALGSVVLSLGYVARVVAGTVNHSRLYRSFMVRIHDYTSSFSSKDLRRAIALAARGRFRDALASFKRHPTHRFLGLVPWLPTFALFALIEPWNGESRLISALIAWGVGAIVVTLVTASDTFKFLGEAERYMEFALLPFVALSFLLSGGIAPFAIFAILAYCLFRLGLVYTTPGRAAAAPEMLDLIRWFASREPTTVMTIPGRLCYPLLYRTAHRAVWWFINAPRGGETLRRWKSLFEPGAVYPFIAPEAMHRAHAAYGAELIVIDKAGADAAAKYWGLNYDVRGYRTVYENARYVVIDSALPAQAAA
jgi:hypothetical protein